MDVHSWFRVGFVDSSPCILRRSDHSTTVGFIGRPPLPTGSEQDRVKRRYLGGRVQAVSQQGGFGYFRWDAARNGGTLGSSVGQTAYRLG